MTDKDDECEFCKNPGEYHHRLITLESDVRDLETKIGQEIDALESKMSQEMHLLTVKVDKFMFLLFGTFVSSATAAIGAILTISILW